MKDKIFKEKRFLHFGLSTGQYEACVIDYPEVKDYMEFLKMVVSITKEEDYDYNISWFIDNDFTSCLKVCEEVKDRLDLIIQERDLMKAMMRNYDLDYWILLMFKPEYYLTHHNIFKAANVIEDMFDFCDDLSAKNPKINKLCDYIKLISNEHPSKCRDNWTSFVLFYCYVNDNYEYIDRFLANYDYYIDVINMNINSNGTPDDLFNSIKTIISLPKTIIK